jgi:hypothetical protein
VFAGLMVSLMSVFVWMIFVMVAGLRTVSAILM